eukprot:4443280-Pyramimonas_sp.AAC.1
MECAGGLIHAFAALVAHLGFTMGHRQFLWHRQFACRKRSKEEMDIDEDRALRDKEHPILGEWYDSAINSFMGHITRA